MEVAQDLPSLGQLLWVQGRGWRWQRISPFFVNLAGFKEGWSRRDRYSTLSLSTHPGLRKGWVDVAEGIPFMSTQLGLRKGRVDVTKDIPSFGQPTWVWGKGKWILQRIFPHYVNLPGFNEGGGGGGRGSPLSKAFVTPLAARTVLMKSSCLALQLDFGGATCCKRIKIGLSIFEKLGL